MAFNGMRWVLEGKDTNKRKKSSSGKEDLFFYLFFLFLLLLCFSMGGIDGEGNFDLELHTKCCKVNLQYINLVEKRGLQKSTKSKYTRWSINDLVCITQQ